jgi:hypothetical protein
MPRRFTGKDVGLIEGPESSGGLLDDTSGGSAHVTELTYGLGVGGPNAALPLPKIYELFNVRGSPSNESELITVTAGKTVKQNGNADCTLNLEWILQNQIFHADIDLLSGVTFSLFTHAFKLSVTVLAQPSEDPIPVDMVISASAAYGARPASAPPQLTLRVLDTVPAYRVAVPAFARGVYPLTSTVTPHFVLHQIDAGGNPISVHPYDVGGLVSPLRIPLAGHCGSLEIYAPDGGEAVIANGKVSYLFDLSL